jgi:hypothetical protein
MIQGLSNGDPGLGPGSGSVKYPPDRPKGAPGAP